MYFKILKQFSCFYKSLVGGAKVNWVVWVILKVTEHGSSQQTGQFELTQNKSLLLENKMYGKYEINNLS